MIRSLGPDEPIPEGEPRRYPNGRGYIRLRWRVGPGEYVECYEHRVIAGRPPGRQVHHRNRDRGDNDPTNLAPLTTAEHGREHRVIDDAEVVRLYDEGLGYKPIAALLGHHPASVLRAHRRAGGRSRSISEAKRVQVDDDRLRALHATPGFRVPQIAEALDVGQAVVRRRMRELGLPPFPPGRLTGLIRSD
jgi:hypothetical protein